MANKQPKSVLIMIVSAEGTITYCRKERNRIPSQAIKLLEHKFPFKN